MRGSRRNWVIWIENELHGEVGVQSYYGSELGAKQKAGKLAAKAGKGWKPGISEKFEIEAEIDAPSWTGGAE